MSGSDSEHEGDLVEELAAALDAILTELVAYRLSRLPSSDPVRLRRLPMTAVEKRQALISRIIEDPFEGAMLFALRGVGEELFRHGGTPLMRAVLADVARRDPENDSRRASPADAQWDGIGDEDDFWIA
jgi:hypothetical protein